MEKKIVTREIAPSGEKIYSIADADSSDSAALAGYVLNGWSIERHHDGFAIEEIATGNGVFARQVGENATIAGDILFLMCRDLTST